MTKFDRRYMDPVAYEDLVDRVDLNREWRGPASDQWRKAVENSNWGTQIEVNKFFSGRQQLCRIVLPMELARSWVISWSEHPAEPNVTTQDVTSPVTGMMPQLFPPSVVSRSYLRVAWGSGGSQNVALVDWTRGGQVSVAGSFVDVVFIAGDIGGNFPTLIGATISPGTVNRMLNTCTVYYGTIGVGANVLLATPPWAKRFTHIFNPTNEAGQNNTRVLTAEANGSALASWHFVTSANSTVPRPHEFLNLPPTATHMRVTNTGANAMSFVQVNYELAL